MAMPISALVSAGASLIPSPTIATLPCFISLRITVSFPSGRTPAITSSTPASLPTAFAVFSLSPVSITTFVPMFLSCFMASGLSSLIVSATAIIPAIFPFLEKNRGVLPFSERVLAFSFASSDISADFSMNLRFPPKTSAPSSFA